MPAQIRSEFALALNQVATERGIDPNVVLESIKAAIGAAYRKDYGNNDELEELTVELNPDNGEAKIFKGKKDITPPGFGRIAAQTAKQVILQRIREAEKQAILTDYSAKVGMIVSGMVLRFDGPNIIVDIGRGQGVMPPQEQISQEHYRLNQRYTFYIEGIRETYRGSEIIVSRAHKGLVSGLFNREVPEVASQAVEIREIAREAGNRSKVAVFSTQPGVDPVGSCVGQKGVRVQAVISELGGSEKIDIIQWNEDPKQYIIASLSPAKDLQVILNDKLKSAQVMVPEDQLSLAIGRDGQNVRLASKLTGWKIDLKGKTVAVKADEKIEDNKLDNKIEKTEDNKTEAVKLDDKTEKMKDNKTENNSEDKKVENVNKVEKVEEKSPPKDDQPLVEEVKTQNSKPDLNKT